MAEARAIGMPAMGKVHSSMGALEPSTEGTTRVLMTDLAIPDLLNTIKSTYTECVSGRIENRFAEKTFVPYIHFSFIYHSQMMGLT